MARSAYGYRYRVARRLLLGKPCHLCGEPGSDSADHVPALHAHAHLEGTDCCRLLPAHRRCNYAAGGRAGRARQLERLAKMPAPSRSW